MLAAGDPPRFVHPVIRDALEASLGSDERDRAHRRAARLLHADGAPPGRVAAHLAGVRPAGDGWVLARLREAARAAMDSGAPQAAAVLLGRALAEPPPLRQRAGVLREAARAEVSAGAGPACVLLEEALRLVADRRERAEIALEVAEAYAALFRWVDAVDVIERALAELGEADEVLTARLEGELVVCGLHDARSAPQVTPVLARLGSRRLGGSQRAARGRAGNDDAAGGPAGGPDRGPAGGGAGPRRPGAENWDTRAALLWVLVSAERFATVEESLKPMLAEVHRSGSARGFVATYSTLGLLKLRLGALPEADAAARVALRVLQEGDFAPGLGFAATVLADVAVEAGELDEAQALLDLLPQQGWPAGVGTVLIPAARGRLRLAQGRAADAFADFEACSALFGADVWGMRDPRDGLRARTLRRGARAAAARPAPARVPAGRGRAGRCARVRRAARARGRAARRRPGPRRRGGARAPRMSRWQRWTARPRCSSAPIRWRSSGAALRRSGERAAAREPSRPGARARRPLRRPAAGRPGPRRAEGDGRPPAAPVAHRRGGTDPQRAAGRPARRRGPLQPRDRL